MFTGRSHDHHPFFCPLQPFVSRLGRLCAPRFSPSTLTGPSRNQVRELERLSWTEGITAKQLRGKLENIATTFLAAESESEVNVQGCSRVEVLCAIQTAIEASRNHPVGVSGEGPWSWVLATAATKALVHLTQEIYPLIFDGLWPRFLVSEEFKDMINTKVCTIGLRTPMFVRDVPFTRDSKLEDF